MSVETSTATSRSRARGAAETLARFSLPDGAVEGAIGCAAVAAVAFADGGYWPTAWGWVAIPAVGLLGLTLATKRVSLGSFDVIAVGALGTLACWVAASGVWGAPARAFLEAERSTMYVAVFATALVVIRRGALVPVLTGVWIGVVTACGYGLLTRLLPGELAELDSASGYRLSEPLGYWNGLGVFAAMGFVLALGLAARGAAPAIRTLAAASLPVLGSTLYFTFSRGAWIALAIGLIAAIALDPRRLQLVTTLLVLTPVVAVGLVVAYRSPGLNRIGSSLPETSQAGHRLAAVLVAASVANALLALALQRLERRFAPNAGARRLYTASLAAAALAALLVVFVQVGSPPTLVSRAYEAFAAPPPRVGAELNERLFSLSGNGRVPQWRVAWRAFEREPVLGSGAGTYEQAWNELRPYAAKVRDAHNLYVETLAELGPLGLALLATALGVPVLAAARARRVELVPGVLGAFVVFIVHAGVDWDWELPAVTLVALLCAAGLVVPARGGRAWPLSGRRRDVALVASLVVGSFSLVGLLGNRALSDADEALRRGDTLHAIESAHSALRWAPWSADAHRLLAEAHLAQGNVANALINLREAVAADPRDWTLWFALAQVSTGPEHDEALLEARRLNPRSPEINSYAASFGSPP